MSDYDRLIQEGLHYQMQESNRLKQREVIENAKLKDELYKLNQRIKHIGHTRRPFKLILGGSICIQMICLI